MDKAEDAAAEGIAADGLSVDTRFGSPLVAAAGLGFEEVLSPPQAGIFAAVPGIVDCPARRRLSPDESLQVLCEVPVGFELSSPFDPSSFVLVPSCLTSSSSWILAVLTPDLG